LYYESGWEQKRKEIIMNKTTKIILIVIGSLLVVCACASAVLLGTGAWSIGKLVQFAEQNTSEDPQKVTQVAEGIATFDVPTGFKPQYSMQIADFTMAQYMTADEKSVILLTQFPTGTSINMDEMMQQIKEGSRRPGSPWYNMDTALVEQKPITIRGEETKLSISEGTNDKGVTYRMATTAFPGNGGGPVVVILVVPADEWNDQLVEDFIASIQ
jgi:hypothetical protein